MIFSFQSPVDVVLRKLSANAYKGSHSILLACLAAFASPVPVYTKFSLHSSSSSKPYYKRTKTVSIMNHQKAFKLNVKNRRSAIKVKNNSGLKFYCDKIIRDKTLNPKYHQLSKAPFQINSVQ